MDIDVEIDQQVPKSLGEFADKWQGLLMDDAELDFPAGWLQIADAMMTEIQTMQAIGVSSLVNDLGQLESSTVLTDLDSPDEQKSFLVTDHYRRRSKQVCEVCGMDSYRVSRSIYGGTVRCLCEECRTDKKQNTTTKTGTWLDQF